MKVDTKIMKKRAQSLVEYGLILALVAVVAISALQLLGKKVNDAADKAGDTVRDAADNAALEYCKSLDCTGISNGVCTGCPADSD